MNGEDESGAGARGSLIGWRPPEPRELPEMRGKLVVWLQDKGPGFYLEMTAAGSQQVFPAGPNRFSSAVTLARQELDRVAEAELYWVSAEMSVLAKHAGRQLARAELYEHDLPSPAGFMVFADPIATVISADITIDVVAVSWGVIRSALTVDDGGMDVEVGADWPDGGVWFTFYSDPSGPIRAVCGDDEDCQRRRRAEVGPFMPDNELVWRLGTVEDLPDDPELTSAWGQTVCAAWLLMRQPLAEHTRERAPRPARRRLTKASLPEGDVKVVRVRTPQHRTPRDANTGIRARDYRVWVTGHWRRYHCGPGRTRIERRWISPYLSGPDDAPIRRAGEHVRVWDR